MKETFVAVSIHGCYSKPRRDFSVTRVGNR